MSNLTRYTTIAKNKSTLGLSHAIKDIKKAWEANPDFADIVGPHAAYAKKLWAEWDAYTVELQSRHGRPHCPTCGRS